MTALPKPKSKRMSAGKRDLSKAVKKVHARPKRAKTEEEVDLSTYPEHLFLAAGDAAGRDTYFDFNDTGAPVQGKDGQVYVVMAPRAMLADYRTKEGKRAHRSMITIPPKLRESLREAFGVSKDEDFALTTALVALADYGAMVLKRDQKCLYVEPAEDPYAEERKVVRRAARNAGK